MIYHFDKIIVRTKGIAYRTLAGGKGSDSPALHKSGLPVLSL